MLLPYSPVAGLLGLAGPPIPVLLALAVITAHYVFATEVGKRAFYRSRLQPRRAAS